VTIQKVKQPIDVMFADSILFDRPLVVTAVGVRLCRPSEVALAILPVPQRGALTKEDDAPVVGVSAI
jgi:arsenate reductase